MTDNGFTIGEPVKEVERLWGRWAPIWEAVIKAGGDWVPVTGLDQKNQKYLHNAATIHRTLRLQARIRKGVVYVRKVPA